MAEADLILFANGAFYHAFAARDLPAMTALWARTAPVTCIHPGWDVITEREEIIASWRAIFAGPNPPDIRCQDARVHAYRDIAVVTCHEIITGAALTATNIFVREGDGWKIVHHQAGPLPAGAVRGRAAEERLRH